MEKGNQSHKGEKDGECANYSPRPKNTCRKEEKGVNLNWGEWGVKNAGLTKPKKIGSQ